MCIWKTSNVEEGGEHFTLGGGMQCRTKVACYFLAWWCIYISCGPHCRVAHDKSHYIYADTTHHGQCRARVESLRLALLGVWYLELTNFHWNLKPLKAWPIFEFHVVWASEKWSGSTHYYSSIVGNTTYFPFDMDGHCDMTLIYTCWVQYMTIVDWDSPHVNGVMSQWLPMFNGKDVPGPTILVLKWDTEGGIILDEGYHFMTSQNVLENPFIWDPQT